jgi:hypothetical protein
LRRRQIGSERIDPNFGVSFKLLPRWKIDKACRWNDDGEPATTVSLHDSQQEAFAALYYRLFRSGETRTPDAFRERFKPIIESLRIP